MRYRWAVLTLLFIVLPVVEIYFLIQIGQVIGPWWTILLLIADGVFGSWLVKHEGGRAWRALTSAIESGRMPHRELADAALILVGGTLLVTPGFVTDVAGLFCVLPFSRPLARRLLGRAISRRLNVGPPPPTVGKPGPPDGVVQGEVVE